MKKLYSLLVVGGFLLASCSSKCEHVDANNDHLCDLCSCLVSNHKDDDSNHLCDICEKKTSYCIDSNFDHKCDICNQVLSEHVDINNDHICEYCYSRVANHIDNDRNHFCDICGSRVNYCEDLNRDHKCDVCGSTVSNHIDSDSNGKCDICNCDLHTCVDYNKDHKCDTCGKVLNQHNDGNGDHNCDICGVKLSDHSYSYYTNGKHECFCGDTQACVDGNGDNKCDVCGHEMSVAPVDLKLTLEYENLFEAAGSKSTGYSAITAITNLGGYTVSFENVCINNLNSKSSPTWATPGDEEVKVLLFKNPKTAAGVVKFPNVKCSKVSIYLFSSYNIDNDFSVTHGSSVIPMTADEGTATDYATVDSMDSSKTYPIKKYALIFNVNATSAGELKINNNGTGARYVEKIVIE